MLLLTRLASKDAIYNVLRRRRDTRQERIRILLYSTVSMIVNYLRDLCTIVR